MNSASHNFSSSQATKKQFFYLFLEGLWLPFESFIFLSKNRQLWWYVLVPILAGLCFSFFVGLSLANWIDVILTGFLTQYILMIPVAIIATVLNSLIHVLIWMFGLMAAVLLFGIAGGFFLAPFNESLARKVLLLKGALPKEHPANSFISIMWLECKKLVFILAVTGFAILLGFVPFMQVPATLLSGLAIAFEYLGLPALFWSKSVRGILQFIGQNFWKCLGLSLGLVFLFSIPFVNVGAIPLAVVACCLLWAETTKH